MQYNINNPAVKRILREVKEMDAEPNDQYHANPLEDNIFEWHFTIRGPKDTEFEGGLYHGRILLPPEYPFKPPNIVLLNESGRFEVGTKICLSISSYHPEHWQPSWSIRTVLVALISFMPTKGDGAIGAIDLAPKDRKVLALKTPNYLCEKCGKRMCDILTPQEVGSQSETTQEPATTTSTTSTPPTAPSTSSTDTTTTTTTSTTSTQPAPETASPSTSSPASVAPTTTTAPVPSSNHNNNAPIYVPPSPSHTLPPPATSSPSISAHVNPQPAAPQPIINPQPMINHPPALQFVQNNINNNNNVQQQVQAQSPNDVTGLDYAIMAIFIALIGLLIKKFYGL